MAYLQGIKRIITDVATVCTEKQFADLCAKDASMLEKEYVRLDVKQVRGDVCGEVTRGELKSVERCTIRLEGKMKSEKFDINAN